MYIYIYIYIQLGDVEARRTSGISTSYCVRVSTSLKVPCMPK